MGWLRLVGSLKLQVSFAEYHLFYRALLQKRPMILRSLQVVATPQLKHSDLLLIWPCVSTIINEKSQLVWVGILHLNIWPHFIWISGHILFIHVDSCECVSCMSVCVCVCVCACVCVSHVHECMKASHARHLPRKWQVSFAEYHLFYRALLQKRPMIVNGTLEECVHVHIMSQLSHSINLQVSFAKETYKRDYILQKRPIILTSLLICRTGSTTSSWKQGSCLSFVLWGGCD